MCILTKERVRVEPDTDSYIYIGGRDHRDMTLVLD